MKMAVQFNQLGIQLRKNLDEFWPIFLGAHLDRRNQYAIAVGTLISAASLTGFAFTTNMTFLATAIGGYLCSRVSHFIFENSIALTLRNPLVATLCEVKMVILLLTGKLKAEQERLFGSSEAAPGSSCLLTPEEEAAYQEALRERVRMGLRTDTVLQQALPEYTDYTQLEEEFAGYNEEHELDSVKSAATP
jgi:hypothetical protein